MLLEHRRMPNQLWAFAGHFATLATSSSTFPARFDSSPRPSRENDNEGTYLGALPLPTWSNRSVARDSGSQPSLETIGWDAEGVLAEGMRVALHGMDAYGKTSLAKIFLVAFVAYPTVHAENHSVPLATLQVARILPE